MNCVPLYNYGSVHAPFAVPAGFDWEAIEYWGSSSTRSAAVTARNYCRSPGRCSCTPEEIDTTTGQHLGNFQQAFTHMTLIEAVSLLIGSESEDSPAEVR